MRTTVSIDDDIFNTARYIAKQRKTSIGKVLSELARKGLKKPPELSQRNGFPVFQVPDDAMPITPEHVRQLEDEA